MRHTVSWLDNELMYSSSHHTYNPSSHDWDARERPRKRLIRRQNQMTDGTLRRRCLVMKAHYSLLAGERLVRDRHMNKGGRRRLALKADMEVECGGVGVACPASSGLPLARYSMYMWCKLIRYYI